MADSESVSVSGDVAFVSFERFHRVWRYGRLLEPPPVSVGLEAELSGCGGTNEGVEATTLLDNTTLFVVCEGTHRAITWSLAEHRVVRSADYWPSGHSSSLAPVGAATLPYSL
eukprot:6881346-Prymnesium_polylepis.1